MKKSERVLQLKIMLNDIKPVIWRRFLIKDSISFKQLHNIIQKVMGWDNYHLYEFVIGDFSISPEDEDNFIEKSKLSVNTKVSTLLNSEKQKFDYIYDFGDYWEHKVIVEKIIEQEKGKKYPICLEGERACPPEDCGGVDGYYELMKIRRNKKHPEYEEMIVGWLGEDYNPELFVVDCVNAHLQGKKPRAVWMMKK